MSTQISYPESIFDRYELPAWLVLLGNYAGWLWLTWNHAAVPWWLMVFLGGYLVCVHGSLQHEFLHGHPTRLPWLNALLVWLPLGLWMPYPIYRDSHIAHHKCERLTDPIEDPESYYFAPASWRSLPGPVRQLLLLNNTLAGRLIIGPLIVVGRFWYSQARQLLAGDRRYAVVWAWHLVGCAILSYWLLTICHIPLWQYVLLVAWPGLSLTLLRSFTEHRPAGDPNQRSIIIEGSWLTRLMFLNNNYHQVHHAQPALAWHRIKTRYTENRDRINADIGGFYFKSYTDVFRNYFFKVKDIPEHPAA